MASLKAISRACIMSNPTASAPSFRRLFHNTVARNAISNLQMPAMSPTMTEGGISSWKKREGEAFGTGDVLLEIETDKATIDVEAQDDGIMGKILFQEGSKNIPVGKVIALLAEEGDDISNLAAPKETDTVPLRSKETSPSSSDSSPQKPEPDHVHSTGTPEPHSQSHAPLGHSRPLFPSVHRLLLEHNVTNLQQIKGTGVRGMLTKGDVLTFLGKASNPLGTFKFGPSPIEEASKFIEKKSDKIQTLDGAAIRRLIVNSMLQSSIKARNPRPDDKAQDFDSIISDYLPPSPKPTPQSTSPSSPLPQKPSSFLDGLY